MGLTRFALQSYIPEFNHPPNSVLRDYEPALYLSSEHPPRRGICDWGGSLPINLLVSSGAQASLVCELCSELYLVATRTDAHLLILVALFALIAIGTMPATRLAALPSLAKVLFREHKKARLWVDVIVYVLYEFFLTRHTSFSLGHSEYSKGI